MRRSLGALAVVLMLVVGGCAGASDVGTPTADTTERATASESPPSGSGDASTTEHNSATTSAPTSAQTPTTTSEQTSTATDTATAMRTATQSLTTSTARPTETTTRTPTATTAFEDQTSWQVEVVRVVDGDTLEVAFPDGHTEDIRLLGIDTPEVHVETDPDQYEGIPDTADGRDWLRDWGHKASEFARTRLAGETVRIETDPDADRRGSYGRLLVYVYDDGRNFNLELIDQGYARLYDSPFSLRSTFRSSEATAQENDVGLWNYEESGTTTNGAGKSSTSELSVLTVHADAEGNDNDNPNGEWIVLENTGDSELDLTGWTLGDEASHTYSFPDGFTLGPGETVTLYTGSGTDSANELYWGSDSAIWNNGGDTVTVRDATGSIVVEYGY